MNPSYVSTKAKWIIWCTEIEDCFVAFGSRNIGKLDVEAVYGWASQDLTGWFGNSREIPNIRTYNLTGVLAGFTMVSAKTELEAFVSLMHTLHQEEACEKAEAEVIAKRIKEEKKRKKAHEKAVRQAAEGKFDAAKCPETCWYCGEKNDSDFCCGDCG